jgi:hypothetical protein
MWKGMLGAVGLSLLVLMPLAANADGDRFRRHGQDRHWHSHDRQVPHYQQRDFRRHSYRPPFIHFHTPYRAGPRYYSPPRWHATPRHGWQGSRFHAPSRHIHRPPVQRHHGHGHRHGGRHR